MPEFNYLKDRGNFPHIDNVNVYKYDNELDYSRFDYTQMRLQICSVPWDMGEAHIGNRTISGIGNVVYFGSKAERDKWFDEIPDSECYRFETKFKELHKSLLIDVPIPYDMCARHNYLRVKYSKFANDDSPLEYEGDNGLNEWFWFIREVEFLAPNTTRLILMPDAFQTWIYDVNISGMLLERGHAPMFAMPTDTYLQNPIENNEYLLTDDVNFGDSMQTKHIDSYVFNSGNMLACVATTADPLRDFGNWENYTWRVPASAWYTQDGVPNIFVFAMKAENLNRFLENVDSDLMQFKQTIQAVFFVNEDLITVGSSFTFCSTTCYIVNSKRKTIDFVDLNKAQFSYPPKYENMAKLYTYPYAQITITDENGNTDIVRIEDTDGKIGISSAVSLSYPFLNISTHLLGIGGNALNVITYKNLNAKTFPFGGNWFEYLHEWQIPTFAVVLDPYTEADYATFFDRRQAQKDYYAAWDNAYDLANTQVANAGLNVAANSASAAASNTSATAQAENTIGYNASVTIVDNGTTMDSALSTVAAADMQGTLAAASGFASGAIGSIGIGSGGMPSIGVSGLINSAIGASSTLASTAIGNGLTISLAADTIGANIGHQNASDTKTRGDLSAQIAMTNSTTAAQNGYISGSNANSAATTKGNADRLAYAAQNAIDFGWKQAGLRAPLTYGDFTNGDSATTKPIGLFAQIQTQSKAAISSAGDEFARYGYTFDKQWNFDGNWNIGKYFTYWKLRDFWVSNLNVPDMYMDRLRFFLFGGVTVWRKPEYIGNINIYDNF